MIVVVLLIAVNYSTIIVMPSARLSSSGKWENDVQFPAVGAGSLGAGLFISC